MSTLTDIDFRAFDIEVIRLEAVTPRLSVARPQDPRRPVVPGVDADRATAMTLKCLPAEDPAARNRTPRASGRGCRWTARPELRSALRRDRQLLTASPAYCSTFTSRPRSTASSRSRRPGTGAGADPAHTPPPDHPSWKACWRCNPSRVDRRQFPALPAAATVPERVPATRHQDGAGHGDYCKAGGEDDAEWLSVSGQRSCGAYQLPYSEGQYTPARERAGVPAALPPDEPGANSQADGAVLRGPSAGAGDLGLRPTGVRPAYHGHRRQGDRQACRGLGGEGLAEHQGAPDGGDGGHEEHEGVDLGDS